jgi:tetratricopeptide (TPR) repeat protein
MDTRNLLRERLRLSRDWVAAIDELEKELEASGTKLEQSERLYELAALVEDVIPERERALGLYQRAWKLYPDNLKALSRAREVYGELGRFEMVAKLGEMELRSPMAPTNLAQIVGEAMLDNGQRDKALPVLERALERTPESVRVQDALAALDYEPEFWTDAVELILEKVDRADDVLATRMLLKAARIVKCEAPEDPQLEALLKRLLAKDIDEPSANFMYETLLAAGNRWDELEAHHRQRAERAADHGQKIEALRTFALEWVQRFKDKDRGAKFFDEALKASSANGAAMKSPVAAFSLLCQVQGQRGEWSKLLELADRASCSSSPTACSAGSPARRSSTSRSRPARSRSTRPTTSIAPASTSRSRRASSRRTRACRSSSRSWGWPPTAAPSSPSPPSPSRARRARCR